MIVKKITAEQIDTGVILRVAAAELAQSEHNTFELDSDLPEGPVRTALTAFLNATGAYKRVKLILTSF